MLQSHLEIVQQAKQFLTNISEQEYVDIATPHLSGSAGTHMRHVLDHYLALIQGVDKGVVDYNKRRRFSDIESDPKQALDVWRRIETELIKVSKQSPDTELKIHSEMTTEHCKPVEVNSTLARELVFVSSHAIHHFSLLAISRSLQGRDTPEHFGLAPATLSFLRQQA